MSRKSGRLAIKLKIFWKKKMLTGQRIKVGVLKVKSRCFLFVLFVFCSCDHMFEGSRKLSIVEYRERVSSSVEQFVSRKPLSGILSKEYYLIKALFPQEQSQLKLFSHFQGFETKDGVRVQMERLGKKLLISLSVSSYPPRVLFEKENYFADGSELDLTIEVQNGTNYGFRVRVWENFINRRNVLRTPEDILTEKNLIADSFTKEMSFYDQGWGLKWGIQLFRAHLTEGARVSPGLL